MLPNDDTNQSNKKGLQFNGLEYLGIAAGLFALIGGTEQLIHTYNKKRADDISYIFILGAIISAILWVIYHYRKRGGRSISSNSRHLNRSSYLTYYENGLRQQQQRRRRR